MNRMPIVLMLTLCACAPLLDVSEAPRPGDKVPDAASAMALARKLCDVSAMEIWLSPYRWRVARHGGIWHVRVPAFGSRLDGAYDEIDIRAADGAAPTHCEYPFVDTVIVAGAR